MKEKRMKQAYAQNQVCSSPSLQPSLRCCTLAFLATLVLRLWFIGNDTFALMPVIKEPQFSTFTPVQINPPQGNKQRTTNNNSQLDQYEKDKRELQQQNAALYETIYKSSTPIKYDLPSGAKPTDVECFRKASDKLNRMLSGLEPMNLKQAIFAIENAYFGGKLYYQKFDKEIQNLITIAKLKAAQDGYN